MGGMDGVGICVKIEFADSLNLFSLILIRSTLSHSALTHIWDDGKFSIRESEFRNFFSSLTFFCRQGIAANKQKERRKVRIKFQLIT